MSVSRDAAGTISPPPREIFKLPKRGQRKVYLVTSAQSNTGIHTACWRNLLALAAHDDAEVLVASFTYSKPRASVGAKRKTAKEAGEVEEWWAPEVEPYLCDRPVQLAPGLVWCGELQILPTAVNPISGLESYTGRDSSIIPHPKFAMQSVASPKGAGTKFIYTTGTVTLRNYIQKKAGQKASFHHGYGALIVEVNHDGSWWVRQLCADSEGTIHDLDRKIAAGRITVGHRPEALVWGDIHARQMEPGTRSLCWGQAGILDALRPRRQVLHDLLDFRTQNHHDRSDAWKVFAKAVHGATDVEAELDEAAEFLTYAHRPWLETAVVASNHDEALIRWLKECDYRADPQNARLMLEASLAAYDAAAAKDGGFYVVEWAVRRSLGRGVLKKGVRFLRRDEAYTVCTDAQGGVELGMHGDVGLNGARGSIQQFAKAGRKAIIGHSHSAGWHEGVVQVGVMAALDQGYNVGQSSWSHSFALVQPNGKRQVVTVWRGKWRG